MQLILLVLILPSFALFGLDSYTRFGNTGDTIAEVNGASIKRTEFELVKKQQFDRLREQFGAAFDPSLLQSDALDQSILDEMIDQRVLQWSLEKERLFVSNDRIQQVIESFVDLQDNGRFSFERYKAVLAAQGRTPQQFESELRLDLLKKQVIGPLAKSDFVPNSILRRMLEIRDASRVISVHSFLPETYLKDVKIQASDIQKYYENNTDSFKASEFLDVDYVILSPEFISKKIIVSDDQAKTYYEQNKSRFSTPEKRKVRHILFTVPNGADSVAREKIKQKADVILQKLKVNPSLFATLAKAESQDPGSASLGGQLQPFTKDTMVKTFEDVAFALNKGQMSDLVETDFGYHIIELQDIIKSEVKPFHVLRAEIIQEIQNQQAKIKFSEMAEEFSNLVFDQPDSLKSVVDRFGLTIQKASFRDRKPANSQNPVPAVDFLGNGEFIASLFTDEVLNKGNNSKAITVNGQMVSARATKYEPSSVLPIEKVKTQIEDKLVRKIAAELAQLTGEKILAKIQQGADLVNTLSFDKAQEVSRAKPNRYAVSIVNAAMKANIDKLPSFVGVSTGESGYAIVKIVEAVPYQHPDLKSPQFANDKLLRRLNDTLSQSSNNAMNQVLRKEANVKMH